MGVKQIISIVGLGIPACMPSAKLLALGSFYFWRSHRGLLQPFPRKTNVMCSPLSVFLFLFLYLPTTTHKYCTSIAHLNTTLQFMKRSYWDEVGTNVTEMMEMKWAVREALLVIGNN